MPDCPMTLQGETLAWVMYSPVTHLPSDMMDNLKLRGPPLSDVTPDVPGEQSNTAGGKVMEGDQERITCFPSRQLFPRSSAADSGPGHCSVNSCAAPTFAL
ncbi:hypothetical protein D4764_13G0010180 [Takifugu flavidus]|uniref:Uncharacterized protein n=1 Tax=Takifugu flavidus TaxID=433684 RepID=A0A5C6PAX7_9TELE|nr:hypothetical protein D4764_13G0010180 [Takifugu flavidus]